MSMFRAMAAVAVLSVAASAAAGPAGPKVTAKAPKASTQTKAGVQAPKGAGGAKPTTTKQAAASPKADKAVASPKADKAVASAKADKAATAPKSDKSASARKGSTASDATTTNTENSGTTPTANAGTTPTTPEAAEPNAISTKISGKADQLARVKAMLPEGMSLEQATAGFKNQGQFMATLNASKNQGISFADLQKAITVEGLSVGQAVKKVKAAPPTTSTPTTSTPTTTTPTTTTPTTPAPGGSGGSL